MPAEKKKKYSFSAILFGITTFCIFLSFDGSFTIQSIFYMILILLLSFFTANHLKMKIIKASKYLFWLNFVYLISLLINSVLYGMEFYSII